MSCKPSQMDLTAGYILGKKDFDFTVEEQVKQVSNFLICLDFLWETPGWIKWRPELREKLFIIGRYGHNGLCKRVYSSLKARTKEGGKHTRNSVREYFKYLFEPWSQLSEENKIRLAKLFLHVKYNLSEEIATSCITGIEFFRSESFRALQRLAKGLVGQMPDEEKAKRMEFAPEYIIERATPPYETLLKNLPSGMKRLGLLIIGDDGIGKSEFAKQFLRSGDIYETIDIGGSTPTEISTGSGLDAVTRKTKTYSCRTEDGRIVDITDTPGFYMEDPASKDKEKLTEFYTDFATYSEHILGLLAHNVPHRTDESKKIHHVIFCFLQPRWKEWQYSLVQAVSEFAPVTICRLQAVAEKECNENLESLRKCPHLKDLPQDRFVKVLAKDVQTNKETIHAFGMNNLARNLGSNIFEWERSQERLKDLYEKNRKEYFGVIRRKALVTVATFTTACAGAGFIPIPFVDTAVVIPLHVGMLGAISRLFGIKAPRKVLRNIANGLWTGAAANAPAILTKALFFGIEVLKLVPLVNVVAMTGAAGIHAFATSVTGASFTSMLYNRAVKGSPLSELAASNEQKIIEEITKIGKIRLGQAQKNSQANIDINGDENEFELV